VTEPIRETDRAVLSGNTRPEVRPENDRGRVPDTLPLGHLQLLLRRPPELEAELTHFQAEQQDPGSPNFHHWLSAKEFGARFAPAASDIAQTTRWLKAHGFTVHGVPPGGLFIEFSGTAGQVSEAFKTEIHALDVRGERHIANAADPSIPRALAPLVVGVVSLHDFKPHANFKPAAKPVPSYTFDAGTANGGVFNLLVPADLTKIYNLNPLFQAGLSGQGQTIALIEDTDVYSTSDWNTFRKAFGLSGYDAGTFTQVHPLGTAACSAPGVVPGNEGEAELDVEWASAAAPSANIVLAACADTTTAFGGLLALQNLINSTPLPQVVSISYGECETANGSTANAAYSATYQQASAEGISVFVSAGDEGAASCDANQTYAQYGITVSGFASTPYNVAVGGTDFSDTYAKTNGTYWSNTNDSVYGSAKSYVPEIPWNSSCASALVVQYLGLPTAYGSAGLCNNSGYAALLSTAAGSGGPSGCATGGQAATGNPTTVGGSCAGQPKPSWQSLVGNPNDGVRDLPDVSLFSASGLWGHAYVYCDSDTNDTVAPGSPCTGEPAKWSSAGGTSFASPILAGIQALVDQRWGMQGNPNPTYYALARTEYGSSGSTTCNSSNGASVGSSCIFYDVTQGDMDVPCRGTNCYTPSGTYGVLSTSTGANAPAYGTQTGWDFATGIGTVNATNLVNATAWSGALQLKLSMASPVTAGQSVPVSVAVADTYGHPVYGYAATVSFSSSDTNAMLPGAQALDGGVSGPATVMFSTAGVQTLTATSASGTPAPGNISITVLPGPPSSFAFKDLPPTVGVGVPNTFTLAAADGEGNVSTSYGGSASITSTDTQASIPSGGAFDGGLLGPLSVTFQTTGYQTLTATDTAGNLKASIVVVVSTNAPGQGPGGGSGAGSSNILGGTTVKGTSLGCASSPGPVSGVSLLLLAAVLYRRRRSTE
jgi:hypothetical protein